MLDGSAKIFKTTDRYIKRPELVGMIDTAKRIVLAEMAKEGMKGDAGPAGTQGDVGSPGEKGDKGETGSKGDTGAKGETGPKGETGLRGEAGVKGDTGDKGAKGDTGTAGVKGDTGSTGTQGTKGDTGSTGPAGKDGSAGSQGLKGETGLTGAKGDAGINSRVQEYTGVTNALGVATIPISGFTAINSVLIRATAAANSQMVTGVEIGRTLTAITIQGYQAKPTLLLSTGPFEIAAAGKTVAITVIGN